MSNGSTSLVTPPTQPSVDSSAEVELLRQENEQLRSRLAFKNDYIRNKTNELLEVMGTKPLRPEELDVDALLELDPLGIIAGSIKHMLDNLKETNWQLHIANEETEAIFAAVEVGILVIDGQQRIKSCNKKLKQLFFPDKDLYKIIGNLCVDEICQRSMPKEGCACELVLNAKKTIWINNWRFRDRIFNVVATPVRNQEGDISDMVVVYNEITELKIAEEQLSRLNIGLENRIRERTMQLESANSELESFCYTVSHDLRAPLRHISGFANILSEECFDSLNDLGRDCLKRITSASSRMGILIDDLLHLSRVSQAEIKLENVDLSKSAEKIISMFRDTDTGRTVRTVVTDGLSAFGDAVLLDLVLQNLIGNAWKYSSNNPEALIEVGRATVDGKEAFFVRDNGVGFDMAYCKKLFRVFERLHGSEFEGTGIGLATVQRIINRHGGEVWADSSVGNGATFYFTLSEVP